MRTYNSVSSNATPASHFMAGKKWSIRFSMIDFRLSSILVYFACVSKDCKIDKIYQRQEFVILFSANKSININIKTKQK